jgi:hypothetical protein
MNIKNLLKKEAAKAVIGKTLPIGGEKGVSKGKMTLAALVVGIAALVFEYLS